MKERARGRRGCHVTLSTLRPPHSLHLLSVQSSVVQAGHTALEAQFCHPIVDQQEVSQLREKRTKASPPPRLRGVRSPPPALGFSRVPLGTNYPSNPASNLALTHVSQLLLLHHAQGARLMSLPPGVGWGGVGGIVLGVVPEVNSGYSLRA